MSYTLYSNQVASPDAIMANTESFWSLLNFSVHPKTGVLTIGRGFWATYFSCSSAHIPPRRPQVQSPPQSYCFQDAGGFEVTFNRSKRIAGQQLEYGNEFAELYLFGWRNDKDDHPQGKGLPDATPWIDTGRWKQHEHEPSRTEDETPLLVRRLSVADHISDRYVYGASVKENGRGTRSASLCLPFTESPVTQALLTQHGQRFPELSITTSIMDEDVGVCERRNVWTYFSAEELDQNQPLPGEVFGYVMIAQGAFKAIAIDAIDRWYLEKTSFDETLDRLVETVHTYNAIAPDGNSYRRTLESVNETDDRNGVIPASPDQPVEVLFLDNLNNKSRAPVPPLLNAPDAVVADAAPNA